MDMDAVDMDKYGNGCTWMDMGMGMDIQVLHTCTCTWIRVDEAFCDGIRATW
jgi:hypothetical protein